MESTGHFRRHVAHGHLGEAPSIGRPSRALVEPAAAAVVLEGDHRRDLAGNVVEEIAVEWLRLGVVVRQEAPEIRWLERDLFALRALEPWPRCVVRI